MSVVDGGSTPNLVQRVQDILLRPTATWEKIDSEPATVQGLYTGYVCILAAIPAVAGFLGTFLFGGMVFAPFALVGAVVGYLLTLAGVYVVALVIDALAPSFGGTKDPIQAFKVAAYAPTASWLAGIFSIHFMLSILGLLGLYSLFLLYKGLPRLMKVSDDKALVYTVVVIIAMIVVYAVIGMIIAAIIAMGAAGAIGAAAYR